MNAVIQEEEADQGGAHDCDGDVLCGTHQGPLPSSASA